MTIYDEKNTNWIVAFYYDDCKGCKRHKVKRGFKSQQDAKEYEESFLYNLVKTTTN